MIKLTIKQLSFLLQLSPRQTLRVCQMLNFPVIHHSKHNIYHFPEDHSFIQSMKLASPLVKPIYSVTDLSHKWKWKEGYYCTESIRQILSRYHIPVYNRKGKILVYLSDLSKFLTF